MLLAFAPIAKIQRTGKLSAQEVFEPFFRLKPNGKPQLKMREAAPYPSQPRKTRANIGDNRRYLTQEELEPTASQRVAKP